MKHFLTHSAVFCLALSLASASQAELSKAPKVGKLVGHVDIALPKSTKPSDTYRKYTVLVTQRGPQNGQASMLIRVVGHSKLSPKGDFTIILSPGTYQVGINSLAQLVKHPIEETVKITSGKTTKVTIRIDQSNK